MLLCYACFTAERLPIVPCERGSGDYCERSRVGDKKTCTVPNSVWRPEEKTVSGNSPHQWIEGTVCHEILDTAVVLSMFWLHFLRVMALISRKIINNNRKIRLIVVCKC